MLFVLRHTPPFFIYIILYIKLNWSISGQNELWKLDCITKISKKILWYHITLELSPNQRHNKSGEIHQIIIKKIEKECFFNIFLEAPLTFSLKNFVPHYMEFFEFFRPAQSVLRHWSIPNVRHFKEFLQFMSTL